MPLTNHLSNPHSPLGHWVRKTFNSTRGLVARTNKQLKALDTTLPPVGVHHATVGTAMDLRIRYYLDEREIQSVEALYGLELCTQFALGDDTLVPLTQPGDEDAVPIIGARIADAFFEELKDFISTERPRHKLLHDRAEEILNRYCLLLAKLDGLYKASEVGHSRPESFRPLYGARSTVDLLNLTGTEAVDDLTRLSRMFYEEFSHRFGDSVVVGPGFEGSDVIAGCEGDLVLDDCLIDVKTTIRPKIQGTWLRQLVCYYLMDLNDSYGINRVGIYLSRQAKLLEWDVKELMRELTGHKAVDVNALRDGFRSAALVQEDPLRDQFVASLSQSLDARPNPSTPRPIALLRSAFNRVVNWYRPWSTK